jgi:hypothetical protein
MEQSSILDNDIRDYTLMDKINKLYTLMTIDELKIAHSMIALISDHLDKKHFTDKIEINVKALVKTFGELDEIGMTILLNENNQK